MNRIYLFAIFGVFLAACGDPPPEVEASSSTMRTISGTVQFAERIGLTHESRLEVRLLDISLADAAAIEIASRVIEKPGQSPLAFTIDVDGDLIDERNTYSVGAKVFDRDRLIMISDSVSPVLTQGAGTDVTIRAVRVSAADRSK